MLTGSWDTPRNCGTTTRSVSRKKTRPVYFETIYMSQNESNNFIVYEKAPSEDKDWEELTDDERKAATFLGYDEDKWDAED